MSGVMTLSTLIRSLCLMSVFIITLCSTTMALAFESERWPMIKESYFGDSAIIAEGSVITLEAPKRAHDAAVVPIVVNSLDPERQLRRVYLFVDNNPLPLAGIFTFTEEAGTWSSMETRIRINEYTHVRAVGMLSNGELHMAERFVKASGGCSAPALADMDLAMQRAGKMKLLLNEINGTDQDLPSSEAVIKISHPNSSGMQFDQISRNYIPAFYVNTISAELDGVEVLSIETNFSMSENPVVRVSFHHQHTAESLHVVAKDSKGNLYQHTATTSVH